MLFNAGTSYVCFEYFMKENWVHNMKIKVMRLKQKKIIKPGDIPSIRLYRSEIFPTKSSRKSVIEISKMINLLYYVLNKFSNILNITY